jgi:hypothetical protein
MTTVSLPVTADKATIAPVDRFPKYSTKTVNWDLVPYQCTAAKIALFVPYLIAEGFKHVYNFFAGLANNIHAKLYTRDVQISPELPTLAPVVLPITAEKTEVPAVVQEVAAEAPAPVVEKVETPVTTPAVTPKADDDVEVEIDVRQIAVDLSDDEVDVAPKATGHSRLWVVGGAVAGLAALVIGSYYLNNHFEFVTAAGLQNHFGQVRYLNATLPTLARVLPQSKIG